MTSSNFMRIANKHDCEVMTCFRRPLQKTENLLLFGNLRYIKHYYTLWIMFTHHCVQKSLPIYYKVHYICSICPLTMEKKKNAFRFATTDLFLHLTVMT